MRWLVAISASLLLASLPLAFLALALPLAAQNWPQPKEGDFVVRDFKFRTGETLPELRLHYTTLGTPQRDAAGRVTNAVLILHGTGGSGRQFLGTQFAACFSAPVNCWT